MNEIQCLVTTCVRCYNNFEQACHPMAHFSSICRKCSNESAETISDQSLQYLKLCAKHSDEIINRIK